MIDEKLYRQSLQTKGRYRSPLLENCILAIGCRFTDNPEVRAVPDDANSAGHLFFSQAEIYLSYELKSPSITTVQSLFLLSMLSVVGQPEPAHRIPQNAETLCSLQELMPLPGYARGWRSSLLLILVSI